MHDWNDLRKKTLKPAIAVLILALLIFLYFWFVAFPVGEPLDTEAAEDIFLSAYAEDVRPSVLSGTEAGFSRIFFLTIEGGEDVYYIQLMKSPVLPRYTLQSYSLTPLAADSLEIFDYAGTFTISGWESPVVAELSADSPVSLRTTLLRYALIFVVLALLVGIRYRLLKRSKPPEEDAG